MRSDDSCVAQGDDGQEEADPDRDREFEGMGNRIDDPAPHGQYAQGQEQRSGDEGRAQRDLPAVTEASYDAVTEVGVEPHAWRQRDRVVRVEPHYERGDSRRNAGCDEGGSERHAGIGENLGIHEDDVGHRQERCRASHRFSADVGPVFRQAEVAFQPRSHWKRSIYGRLRPLSCAAWLFSASGRIPKTFILRCR